MKVTKKKKVSKVGTKKQSKKSTKQDQEKSTDDLVSRNLAAVYRPKVLDHFVGQKEATNKVKGWIKSKRVPQSILIEGSTGAGKTTLARMIVRYVNCETMNSCGKCSYCKFHKELPDVTYINAGELSGVDDIRKMLNSVQTAPRFRRKFIILDEVHLLSGKALETLLIPLEEPSPKTVWILCTTETDKIKATIRNRCAELNLKPVAPDIITKRLEEIAEQEGFDVDKNAQGALMTIAEYSEGQVRQAISDLDGLLSSISSGDSDFTDESVENLYSRSSKVEQDKVAVSLFLYIIAQDLPSLIRMVDAITSPMDAVKRLNWLISWYLLSLTGQARYTPPIGKILYSAKKTLESKHRTKLGISTSLVCKIGNTLDQIEHTMLTVPGLRPKQHIMMRLSHLVIEDVLFKQLSEAAGNRPISDNDLAHEDPEDLEDTKPKKKKKKEKVKKKKKKDK